VRCECLNRVFLHDCGHGVAPYIGSLQLERSNDDTRERAVF
jgi:hypothetical protein